MADNHILTKENRPHWWWAGEGGRAGNRPRVGRGGRTEQGGGRGEPGASHWRRGAVGTVAKESWGWAAGGAGWRVQRPRGAGGGSPEARGGGCGGGGCCGGEHGAGRWRVKGAQGVRSDLSE
nr:glycine-rich protein DOT1-like [Setaria viridis]